MTQPPRRSASIREAMRSFATNAFRLRGRASRSEYWWWVAVNFVVLAVTQIGIPALITGQSPKLDLSLGAFGSLFYEGYPVVHWGTGLEPTNPFVSSSVFVAGLWVVLTFIPAFTVAVRRLHDSNMSGWWILLDLVPPGALVLIALSVRRPRIEGARFD